MVRRATPLIGRRKQAGLSGDRSRIRQRVSPATAGRGLRLADAVDRATRSGGARPKFLITDHSGQFKARIYDAMDAINITHVRCGVWTRGTSMPRSSA